MMMIFLLLFTHFMRCLPIHNSRHGAGQTQQRNADQENEGCF